MKKTWKKPVDAVNAVDATWDTFYFQSWIQWSDDHSYGLK
jgi:hypothetical protein